MLAQGLRACAQGHLSLAARCDCLLLSEGAFQAQSFCSKYGGEIRNVETLTLAGSQIACLHVGDKHLIKETRNAFIRSYL